MMAIIKKIRLEWVFTLFLVLFAQMELEAFNAHSLVSLGFLAILIYGVVIIFFLMPISLGRTVESTYGFYISFVLYFISSLLIYLTFSYTLFGNFFTPVTKKQGDEVIRKCEDIHLNKPLCSKAYIGNNHAITKFDYILFVTNLDRYIPFEDTLD